MMNRLKKVLLIFMLVVGAGFGTVEVVQASEGGNSDVVIDEKFGPPRVVYGEALTEEQREQVRELLEVSDPSMVSEYTVTAEDLVNYIDGDPSSRMFSSAKITRTEAGNGLVIDIVNPENITEVTNEMYANALLTAGVENAVVEVASPLKVTGHSALTGIYKAFNVEGESLDKERMEVANDELTIATDLAEESGVDQEQVSELLTEIKKAIAEQNPVSREEVEQIVEEQLAALNIELSPEDRELLTNLFERMRSININFDNVSSQLDDLANDIRSQLEDVANNDGFWQAVSNFFDQLITSIRNIFR